MMKTVDIYDLILIDKFDSKDEYVKNWVHILLIDLFDLIQYLCKGYLNLS